MCVTNGRAAAPPCSVCSIGVSTSRKPRASKRLAQRPRRRPARSARHVARLRADDEVDVALADPRLLGLSALVLVRQRPQRLGGERPRVGQHRQLAAPGRDDLARRRRRGRRGRRRPSTPRARPRRPCRARASPAARCRRPRAASRSRACRCCGRTSTRPVTPTRSPVAVLRLEVGVARADLGERVRARVADGVGLDARGEQPARASRGGPASAPAARVDRSGGTGSGRELPWVRRGVVMAARLSGHGDRVGRQPLRGRHYGAE